MQTNADSGQATAKVSGAAKGLSYKFERLRERIRAAVVSGELQGKLPGERALARRFNVNAKTLSKALTDLAAEGLLDRSIGRGTYVKGSTPAPDAKRGQWLVLCTPAQAEGSFVRKIQQANPEAHVVSDGNWDMRPSFLQSFGCVISLNADVPDALLRDLVVRNMNVVTVDYQPRVFSMHAVLDDSFTNAAHLTRALLIDGHRSLVVVADRADETLTKAVRDTAKRIAPEATVDVVAPTEIASLGRDGPVTVICESLTVEAAVRAQVAHRTDASVWSIGCADGASTIGGCYTDERRKLDAIAALLNDPPARPTTVWLAGEMTGVGPDVRRDVSQLPVALRMSNVAMAS